MQTIKTRVPDEIYRDIKEIESEEKTERVEVIRKLLADAIKRWKLKKALDTLREGKTTLRSAAKLAGLTYIKMMDEVEKAGIPYLRRIRHIRHRCNLPQSGIRQSRDLSVFRQRRLHRQTEIQRATY